MRLLLLPRGKFINAPCELHDDTLSRKRASPISESMVFARLTPLALVRGGAAEEWVAQPHCQGYSHVFKKYSQMKFKDANRSPGETQSPAQCKDEAGSNCRAREQGFWRSCDTKFDKWMAANAPSPLELAKRP
jgi:hypothetical protein